MDLDWFASDRQGKVVHFAAGGFGAMPQQVVSSRQDLEELTQFFRRACAETTEAEVSPWFEEDSGVTGDAARARYTRDYLVMARKGLHSFDVSGSGDRPRGYFLVARPATALSLAGLPPRIQELLKRVEIAVGVEARHRIGSHELL